MSATELGSRVHELLEQLDLADPAPPDIEDDRIRAFVSAYSESEIARRVASLVGVTKERPFTFEHDGVLVHGFLDVFHLEGGRALVLDYKTNLIGESTPADIVEDDYRLQRLVYALACFRAGAEEVEVVYDFLERADAPVSTTFTRDRLPELEQELSAVIAQIQAGEFRPTPSEFACAGCPALGLVCAGAVGNLIDRVFSSMGVVDFIDIGINDMRWPTFNVADMAVSTGAFLLAWVLWGDEATAAVRSSSGSRSSIRTRRSRSRSAARSSCSCR